MDDRETILKVASELRQRIGCVHGLCCCASVVLAAMLRKKKLKPKILKGTFQTDLPTEGDYSGEHENGGKSLHYWVQVSGFLVDITADQFNAELEGDDQPEIVVFPRSEASWRYSKGKVVKPRLSLLNAMQRITGPAIPKGAPLLLQMLAIKDPDYAVAIETLAALRLARRLLGSGASEIRPALSRDKGT